MASILVVEDSPDSVALVEQALQSDDLCVATTLSQARALIAEGRTFDLALLDLNLPDGDGLILGSELAVEGDRNVPVIFVSARTDVRDKIAAFSIGAEDYIEKPFDVLELRARVSARLRRLRRDSNVREVRLGELRVDVRNMRAYCGRGPDEYELDLSPTEHRILQTLVARPGGLFTRDHLISRIWGDTIVGPRTVDSHVSNLRRKLKGSDLAIESVRGQGYRVQADAELRTRGSV